MNPTIPSSSVFQDFVLLKITQGTFYHKEQEDRWAGLPRVPLSLLSYLDGVWRTRSFWRVLSNGMALTRASDQWPLAELFFQIVLMRQ